jgi:hypothetical protein
MDICMFTKFQIIWILCHILLEPIWEKIHYFWGMMGPNTLEFLGFFEWYILSCY